MLVKIGVPNAPRQKSLGEVVLEMADREAKEIAELRAQALKAIRDSAKAAVHETPVVPEGHAHSE